MNALDKPIAPTPELADELFRASFPNRIPAIKALRARTGCSLREGKDLIDGAAERCFAERRVVRGIEIKRTIPLKVHKNIVIQFLRQHPEDLPKIAPDAGDLTAEEFIATLEAHPGEWIVRCWNERLAPCG